VFEAGKLIFEYFWELTGVYVKFMSAPAEFMSQLRRARSTVKNNSAVTAIPIKKRNSVVQFGAERVKCFGPL
jgi:hypothetical protein